ncbi:unannotated protein [freshwater metagenome]|uniref:Unannotated protein n=1 Tax=freshwater metagenome TaxID=449393 RepID=A0A6J7M761_9ZZZZ
MVRPNGPDCGALIGDAAGCEVNREARCDPRARAPVLLEADEDESLGPVLEVDERNAAQPPLEFREDSGEHRHATRKG